MSGMIKKITLSIPERKPVTGYDITSVVIIYLPQHNVDKLYILIDYLYYTKYDRQNCTRTLIIINKFGTGRQLNARV